jgi:6-phosphogluconolactonase (cycloisomerase 2 family)
MAVGTYTNGSSEGIYTYRFNTDKLTATPLSKAVVDNPSYLTVSPDAKYIYAVSESGENSAVSAFAFDKQSGKLERLNSQKAGADPCYILLDEKLHFVATANYSGGSVSIIPVLKDGSLGSAGYELAFEGKGVDTVRQTGPHLHCVAASPDKRALFATDLGTDRIYRIEIHIADKNGKFPLMGSGEFSGTKLAPRSGPRHLIFNREGSHAYLINEIAGNVMVFTMDLQHNLKLIQTVAADTCNAEGSADIHLSPDGKYLYVSTRLEGDGIVIFEVKATGELSRTGYRATGKHPRNFVITPDGNWMLVACKDAGMIQIFRINKQTGQLTDTGKSIAIDQPVCIQFVD